MLIAELRQSHRPTLCGVIMNQAISIHIDDHGVHQGIDSTNNLNVLLDVGHLAIGNPVDDSLTGLVCYGKQFRLLHLRVTAIWI